MVSVVLASHGGFAEGIMESGAMIFGQQKDVAAVTLTPDMGPDDLKAKLESAVASFEEQEHVLFFVDLFGATPFNQVNGLMSDEHEDWVMVTGLNLPMLIEAYADRMSMDTAAEIAAAVFTEARNGIHIKPESLEPVEKKEASASDNLSGTLAPGTVIGDGKIKTGLVRIDSRLLHGQVATAWSKEVKPTRIIVVSDSVAHDKMRKTLIVEAAPPGVKANVIPIDKLIEIWDDPRFGGTKALFLFENPHDVLRAVKGGVDFKEVNVGSMAHSAGKTLVNAAIAMDENDMHAFEELRDEGVEFNVRQVPSDKSQDIWALLKKCGLAK